MGHRVIEGGKGWKAVVTSFCFFDFPFTFHSIISLPPPPPFSPLVGVPLCLPLSHSYATGCDRQCAPIFHGRQKNHTVTSSCVIMLLQPLKEPPGELQFLHLYMFPLNQIYYRNCSIKRMVRPHGTRCVYFYVYKVFSFSQYQRQYIKSKSCNLHHTYLTSFTIIKIQFKSLILN